MVPYKTTNWLTVGLITGGWAGCPINRSLHRPTNQPPDRDLVSVDIYAAVSAGQTWCICYANDDRGRGLYFCIYLYVCVRALRSLHFPAPSIGPPLSFRWNNKKIKPQPTWTARNTLHKKTKKASSNRRHDAHLHQYWHKLLAFDLTFSILEKKPLKKLRPIAHNQRVDVVDVRRPGRSTRPDQSHFTQITMGANFPKLLFHWLHPRHTNTDTHTHLSTVQFTPGHAST